MYNFHWYKGRDSIMCVLVKSNLIIVNILLDKIVVSEYT